MTVSAVPVPPKPAATVVLVRDGESGVEVFLLERVKSMVFASGMTVFPGGGVDKRDAEPDVGWVGPPPQWWAERFGVSLTLATALVCAAARETFEECGVLLAGDSENSIVTDTSIFQQSRADLVKKTLSFRQFLHQEGLLLRADLLMPLANWITPAGESRRYDTRFFVAALPSGQYADGRTTEAKSVSWRSPAAAIEDFRAGRTMLLPPTWAQLDAISRAQTVSEILLTPRVIQPIEPRFTSHTTGTVIEFIGSAAYYGENH
ncbi:MAG: NUDIX hydrolase [Mycobacteriaceae bacterium]